MKLKIRNARGSFLDIFEPVQYQGQGEFYWGGSLLVPADGAGERNTVAVTGEGKDWKPARQVIDAALREVARAKWEKKADAVLANVLPDRKACCFVDGNRMEYDGYSGNWALSFKRYVKDGRPMILDADKSPILQADGAPYPGKEGRIYSGCYLNATVELWAQDNKYGKGIRCQLVALQYAGPGDAFSGGARPSADDFDEIADGADASALC